VLLDGDRLIATVAVKRTGEREMDLKRLFVDPAYRRQGLGKRLSLWAYDFARREGCTVLHVWSDVLYHGAHRLYRALGTVDTGRRRSLGGINEVDEFYFEWRIEA
jgi:GNAT superfamily N-acetyltransferase